MTVKLLVTIETEETDPNTVADQLVGLINMGAGEEPNPPDWTYWGSRGRMTPDHDSFTVEVVS